VLRILEVSGLVEVLRTYPTVDEAISADSAVEESASPDGAQRAVSAD
jgi:hypothetical protein